MPHLDDLNSILTWYQNHVGAYDKAKWEQSIEERILHGIAHISTKSAKLGSDLIDLDLVQGSSFPKAKPKHGLFTVTRHALLRFLFLPLYHDWWSAQTSCSIYITFIILYVAQVLNVVLYLTSTAAPSLNVSTIVVGQGAEQEFASTSTIQTSDILSPIVLMIILTILHSQIVSTHYWSTSRRLLTTPPATATTNRSPRRESRLRRKNSTGSKPHKKTRRWMRVPPSRRRVSNLPPLSYSPHVAIQEGSYLTPAHLVSPIRNRLSPSTSKKVFFVDEFYANEPKCISPSNSDRDEGIPEEITHEQEQEHEQHHDDNNCNFTMTIIHDPIIKKNLAQTMHQFVEEQNRSMGLVQGSTNAPSPSIIDLSTTTTEHIISRGTNLRKRNLSKLSVSTTTPSGSGGECSSGNNMESSTDEEDDDLEEADEGLIEEHRMPSDMREDDEEVRKSEWTAVTTNSEDDDYVEEEVNNSDDEREPTEAQVNDNPFAWEFQKLTSKSTSPSCASSDKVSCTIWEGQDAKKADLSVLDISALIIAKVERAKENSDYLYLGICFSVMLTFLPYLWRLDLSNFDIDDLDIYKTSLYLSNGIDWVLLYDARTRVMITISCIERLSLALCVFFLLAVAEKTYKQRFLYSKLFSRITSTRKSKKSEIPHFRLNKVRNIKTWLSIRSYLQRRGPQRSVDMIVSATFIASLILICFISVELLKDSSRMYFLYNMEVIWWSLCLGIYLMRFMTLGSRISQKYRNLSVIITEQLNLYLKMEQKPHKKDELMVANNVLKLASELLKELENPFKISSFASNPYFYNVTRLVILSAFSGVLSELLGFKLKLYKFKLK